jgi:DNA-binding MarR family transcriptional regulator
MADAAPRWAEPSTPAHLHLPPTFVADHAIRTLAYQGAMTPSEMARRWRVDDGIVTDVIDSLKAAGVVELDGGQATFGPGGRVRLTITGQERVAAARRRTWYAGPIPVAMKDFGERMELALPDPAGESSAAETLVGLAIPPHLAEEMAQAVRSGATVELHGAAFDEQSAIAQSVGRSLNGDACLPYAVYAAGAIVRVFDVRYHHIRVTSERDGAGLDVLRTRQAHTQWATVARPVVMLSGGVHVSDVLPAYDDEARFYVAPMPLSACRGLLAVFDCEANPAGLADLARLWLIPGRHHAGVLMLRSGERIEIPWRAATLLFGDARTALPMALRGAVSYSIDITELDDGTRPQFLQLRLGDTISPEAIASLGGLLVRHGMTTRVAAGQACQYLHDRAVYQGAAFALDESTIQQAVDFAAAAADDGHARSDLRAAS